MAAADIGEGGAEGEGRGGGAVMQKCCFVRRCVASLVLCLQRTSKINYVIWAQVVFHRFLSTSS